MFQMALGSIAAPRRDDLRFFTKGRHTDVEFLVEHGSDPPSSFKAHKMVLAMRNEVFETMFYGSEPKKDQVRITDLHPDGFSAFLKYIYSQKVTFVDVKQALRTRTAAEKYMESELVEACHRFIRNSMQSTDVCDVLEYAVKNGNLADFKDCINRFLGTKTRGGHRNRHGREIIESFLIQNAENNVSSASVTLSRRELDFIRPELEKYRNSP
ncbi:hypothetical protein HPB47_004086 [Ixodes persulcatus]|uniref:Uncharacterized protein n=1 Tax=Ixodes persulcatus TaxID=34615 RepID=A0AC60PGU5_IXOPE|nr:hypothetical protein HPB47_004086 [Ixodes persulcatus]